MAILHWYQGLWGFTGSFDEWIPSIRDEGYEGVEGNLAEITDPADLCLRLRDNGLRFAPLIQTTGPDHFDSFQRLCEKALALDPPYINSHTGRDTMSTDEQDELFERVLAYQNEFSVPVYHETHRSRPTFAPFTTRRLIERFPELKLTADFSHWCCVCESLLTDQVETMAKIIPHVEHIHARVGYHEGPQVPDPAAPEYEDSLLAHEEWWKAILRLHEGRDITIEPEYGPATSRYLHTLPYTDQPVSDMMAVRRWARQRFMRMAQA